MTKLRNMPIKPSKHTKVRPLMLHNGMTPSLVSTLQTTAAGCFQLHPTKKRWAIRNSPTGRDGCLLKLDSGMQGVVKCTYKSIAHSMTKSLTLTSVSSHSKLLRDMLSKEKQLSLMMPSAKDCLLILQSSSVLDRVTRLLIT